MIEIQNIKINKVKTYIIPIKNTKIDDFVLQNIKSVLEFISEINFKTEQMNGQLQNLISIEAKSLNFDYEKVITELIKNQIEVVLTEKIYGVKGMTCASCSNSVETILNNTEFVIKANVNLIENSVKIKYFHTLIHEEDLAQKISSIGYELVYNKREDTNENNLQNDTQTNENINFKSNSYSYSINDEIDLLEKIEIDKLNKIKLKTIVATIFTIPIAIIGMFYHTHNFANYIMLILSIPVVIFSGRDYYKNLFNFLKTKKANMDTLVGMSTGFAIVFSIINTFLPNIFSKYGLMSHTYYESAVVIITFLLIGKYFEEKAKSKTNLSVKKLLALQNNIAFKIESKNNEEVIIEIDANKLNIGDKILIKANSKVPADCKIIKGFSYIDQSMLTGEPIPILKSEGESIFAGTLNTNESLIAITEKVGNNTLLSHLIDSVRKAQSTKAPIQRKVDKITNIFVPIVILIAVSSFIVWFIIALNYSDNNFLFNKYIFEGINSFITVLIVSCPCALGLATPTAIVVGLGKGSDRGILIKDAESFEIANSITDIIFDKTGTLTAGKPTVTQIIWNDNLLPLVENNTSNDNNNDTNYNFENEKNQYLEIFKKIESQSNHPLSSAILNKIDETINIKSKNIFDTNTFGTKILKIENIIGKGIMGIVEIADKIEISENQSAIETKNSNLKLNLSSNYYIGNYTLLDEIISKNNLSKDNIENFNIMDSNFQSNSEKGNTCVFAFSLSGNNIKILCIFIIKDNLKDGTKELITNIKNLNITPHILSGDNLNTVKDLANELNVDNYKAEQLPEDKYNYTLNLQNENKIVAMIGDGINDSTSLAKANLSIAMGGGNDIAIDVAQITFLNSDITKLNELFVIAKQTVSTINLNLFWAFIYNLISIPIATGMFVSYGLKIDPMLASFMMSLSSISVVLNSLYLKYRK